MLGETCPRGFICINHFHALIVLTTVIVIVYFINRDKLPGLYQKINNLNDLENIKQNVGNNLKSPYSDIQNSLDNQLFYQNSNDILQRDRKVINNPLIPST